MATKRQRRTYVIEAVGIGLVRIGVARDVATRLRLLDKTSPVALRLLADLPLNAAPALVGALAGFRTGRAQNRDWYNLTDDSRAAIARVVEVTR
ncbi:MAG: hypothetical protein NT062_05145 [Proteobacteria bacterium]|nr:hypothetical protein [Pseudomonadota bacterium]